MLRLLLLQCLFCATIFAVNENDGTIDLTQFGLYIFGKPITSNERDYKRKSGNPEERGPYLEGDLLIPIKSRNGINSQAYRWPNKQIPYEISGRFSKKHYDHTLFLKVIYFPTFFFCRQK